MLAKSPLAYDIFRGKGRGVLDHCRRRVTGLGALEAELDAPSCAAGLAVVLGAVTADASRGLRTVMSNGLAR
jgi:hypothetical protein